MMAALVSFGAERAEVKNISVNGGIEEGKARLVIEAALQGLTAAEREKLLYSTTLNQTVQITREKQIHTVAATFDILQGEPKEISLTISGEGEIKSVPGELFSPEHPYSDKRRPIETGAVTFVAAKPLDRRRAYVARFRCDRDAGPAEFAWTFSTR